MKTKCNPKKRKDVSEGDMAEQVEKILEERGSKALEEARNQILQEEFECKEVRKALTYFMSQYWKDVFTPTLLSLVCEAVGGDPNITTSIAIPVILISGAIDIHDDIIDQSKIKESRPTVLGKFGKDTALIAGNVLLFKGFTLLCEAIGKEIPVEKAAVIADIIRRMFFELADAEALELDFRGRIDVTPEQYLHVARKKAADVEALTRISAILGGASKEEIEALGEYGRLLGMMMILRDDLIDMADYEEAVHRIKREHLPLPILYALQNPEIKSALSPILLKKTMRKKDAKTILEITEKAGGLERVGRLLWEMVESAYRYVENLDGNGGSLMLLARCVATCLPLHDSKIS